MLQPSDVRMTDEMLLDALKKEQDDAFRAMYLRYEAYVSRFVLDNSGTEADAEDVMQEALVALVQNLRKPGFTVQTNVGSFFQAIVRNWWLYKLRSRKRQVPIENVLVIAGDSGEVTHKENAFTLKQQLVARVFDLIGEDCRHLVQAFYLQRKSLAEIAAEMGYTDNFVKLKKMRCMNAFKEKVFSHPDYNQIREELG